MAIVIDEWGSFEGILTVEDIVEEIVGEIRGEFDEEEPAIRMLPDGSYSIDSRTPIQRVNETLGSKFESRDFDTIGGFVLEHLGRAPEDGDEVSVDGYVLSVQEIDGLRIKRLIARRGQE
jgi:CBS domain containing-hemolysin-like protein